MAEKKIRVIQYGLGPIGRETAKLALRKSSIEVVGAVDISQDIVGRDLGQVLGLEDSTGIVVTDQAKKLFSHVRADVVIHSAGSKIKTIFPQLEEILDAGINVVSSAEELLFPSDENKASIQALNQKAHDRGVTILGTGVNPGFIMDVLPLHLTAVCQDVRYISVERIVDAGTRRLPLQKKVGAGLSEETFRDLVAQKILGHVGLVESMLFVAHYLGMTVDTVEETIDPVIATGPAHTAYLNLKKGDVAGIKHVVKGIKKDEAIIVLDLRMYVGAENPHDTIHIAGTPNISLTIEGGVAGDQATSAILVNSIPGAVAAKPGFLTVKDLPMPHYYR